MAWLFIISEINKVIKGDIMYANVFIVFKSIFIDEVFSD